MKKEQEHVFFFLKIVIIQKTSTVTSVTELNILNGKYILFLLKLYNIELFDGFKLLMSKVNM